MTTVALRHEKGLAALPFDLEHGETVRRFTATVREALRICREHEGPIDLVLTDVVMPEMNGKELYQQLIALRTDLKVLYISGYSADIIAQRGVIEATTNFLGKPFTAAALAKKVRQVPSMRSVRG